MAGQKHHFTPPTFELVPPPGHLKEMLRAHGRGHRGLVPEADAPEYQHRAARLAVMDEQGIESILLFPTYGVTVEHAMRGDAEASFAALARLQPLARGGLGLRRRRADLRRAAALARSTSALAVAELDRLLARGARMVHLLSGPVNGPQPRRPDLRSGLGAARRSARARRLSRGGVGLQRAALDAVGPPRAPALPPPERLAERVLLHRGADHAHARRADLRQRVRPLPGPARRDDRVRQRVGAVPAPAARQGAEELHLALALDRRPR